MSIVFFKKIAVSDLARQEKFKILGIANGLPMHYNLLTTIYNVKKSGECRYGSFKGIFY